MFTTRPIQLQYAREIWHITLGEIQTLPRPTCHRTFICTVEQRLQRRPVVGNDIVHQREWDCGFGLDVGQLN